MANLINCVSNFIELITSRKRFATALQNMPRNRFTAPLLHVGSCVNIMAKSKVKRFVGAPKPLRFVVIICLITKCLN